VLGLILVAPAIGLTLAVCFDRGPSGEPRLSPHLFPLVLWVFDDFAWTCARNSLVFAGVIAFMSLFVGLGVRCLLEWLPSWGRAIFGGMILAMVVVPPAFLALGIRALLAPGHSWPWPSWFEWAGESPGASLESWRGARLWMVWFWAILPAAGAMMALATEPVLARLEPSWHDAARLAGANRLRIWTKLSWPIVRPVAARALGTVFLFALVEPGVPWILGLRRTLAFQIVDTAAQPDPFPTVAVWALMAGLFGVCAAAILRSRGGPTLLENDSSAYASLRDRRKPRRVSSRLAAVSSLLLAVWALACALPFVGLFRLWLGALVPESGPEPGANPWGVLQRVCAPPVPEIAANSAWLGLEVACPIAVIAWFVRRKSSAASAAKIGARLLRPLAQLPPLAQTVGLFALSWLAGLAARSVAESQWSRAGLALESIAAAASPQQNPWNLLVICVCLAFIPWFVTGQAPADKRHPAGPPNDSTREAALLAGSSRWRARGLASRGRRGGAVGWFLLLWALAATNVAPALLFLPWTERLCAGPAVLVYSTLGEGAQPAATLALASIAVDVAAFFIARATSAVPRSGDLE
jgi:iron(III) transport system permease protein